MRQLFSFRRRKIANKAKPNVPSTRLVFLKAVRALLTPRVGLTVGTTCILSFLMALHLMPSRVSYKKGDVATQDVIASRTVRYEDTEETRRQQEEVAALVSPHYVPIAGAKDTAIERLVAAQKILEKENPKITSKTWQQIEEMARRLVEARMERAISDDQPSLEEAQRAMRLNPSLQTLPTPYIARIAGEIAAQALTPNQHGDFAQTERDRQKAREGIPPQMRRLASGNSIVRHGEVVTQQHLDAFLALGIQTDKWGAATVAVVVLFMGLAVSMVCFYLRFYEKILYGDMTRLLVIALLSVVSMVGLKVGSVLLGLPLSGGQMGYLGMMCVASAGMVLANLISPAIATLIVSLLAVTSGVVLNNELRFTLITLGSSLAGILSIAELRNRTDLLRAAAVVCGANVLLSVLAGQLEGDSLAELGLGMLWGVVSGGVAVTLFWLGSALIERWFGLTTQVRLLELADPAAPALQEFRLQVPGTYTHSLMVGNLAHAAAEAIGADALLVRVAAYYHDLGKMNRPEFFIENQSGASNIHDTISPTLSAIVLASHVKEGVEKAKVLRLPAPVIDLIAQHHGTSLMRYFYHRATNGQPNILLERQFRYPGPKPQTREAAILMIADSVEAASRTLENPTPMRVQDFVERIVEGIRLDDGQLDECDLTLRDLSVIKASLVRTLAGTLHARIQYPKPKARKIPHGTPRTMPTGERTMPTGEKRSPQRKPIVTTTPDATVAVSAEGTGKIIKRRREK
jgi:cyclic-di-AMP phosphodiesterase PgpH